MALSTTPGTGSQIKTDTPQSASAPTSGVVQAAELQSGTSSTKAVGIPLQPRQVTAVPLTGSTVSTVIPEPKQQPASGLVTVASILLFVVAIALFLVLAKSEKTTTDQ